MRRPVNARITPQPALKTAVRTSAWALAVDLIPERGVREIQSDNVRARARAWVQENEAREVKTSPASASGDDVTPDF